MNDYINSPDPRDDLVLFYLLKNELDKVFQQLRDYEQVSFEDKKVGVYKHLKKLMPCFDVIAEVAKMDSVQSLITLTRMVVDNYSIHYLLTSFGTKGEQQLRYYLFLLDATTSRINTAKDFYANVLFPLPEETINNSKIVIQLDEKAVCDIKALIKKKGLNIGVDSTIIDNVNWKFKDKNPAKKSNNRYKWHELYSLARIPEHQSRLIQNYYSSYVHGLGMSLIPIYENIDIFKALAYSTCNQVMPLLIKTLLLEFAEETKQVNLNKFVRIVMEDCWNLEKK
ncbi:hypothetical protein J1N10_06840 [Carboxylicivirga sp. A043]|uniref:hypothetical protein n=1 Tax=Carboxylicivirga litoralis TaxID=2816963 RepID=UPI0021CB4764|nr:hypothetical protein [Carboxylicivirga sp. A043]MCU4155688.1 hypothetical protein [Carboxylicivirga sp. A043]